jgi:hypothetical protein
MLRLCFLTVVKDDRASTRKHRDELMIRAMRVSCALLSGCHLINRKDSPDLEGNMTIDFRKDEAPSLILLSNRLIPDRGHSSYLALYTRAAAVWHPSTVAAGDEKFVAAHKAVQHDSTLNASVRLERTTAEHKIDIAGVSC